jgi:hypothetical protein
MMMSRFTTALMVATFIVILPALAAEDRAPVVRGTAGLLEVPFTASNQGPDEIACSAALAHWYSLDLGQATPGGTIEAPLWYDPSDGTIVLLNGSKDRMPVQALWCGFAGRSWATRSVIGLERDASRAPSPVRVTCRPEGERLACR